MAFGRILQLFASRDIIKNFHRSPNALSKDEAYIMEKISTDGNGMMESVKAFAKARTEEKRNLLRTDKGRISDIRYQSQQSIAQVMLYYRTHSSLYS